MDTIISLYCFVSIITGLLGLSVADLHCREMAGVAVGAAPGAAATAHAYGGVPLQLANGERLDALERQVPRLASRMSTAFIFN